MKYIREITAASLLIMMVVMLFSCTPGKAQTRRDGYYDRYKENNNDGFNDRTARQNYDDRGYAEENNEFGNDGYYDDKKYNPDSNASNRYTEEREEKGHYDEVKRGIHNPPEQMFYQTGTASWYGREFHGKVTASGEKFNMHELTAAHKTLPFGSLVKVRNLDNGREVAVRINDRGPYRGNRIMDLSYNAAKKLDILAPGKARVGIIVLKKGDDRYYSEGRHGLDNDQYIEPVVDDSIEKERIADSNGLYSLQAGAFYSKRNARNLQSTIEGMTGNPVVILDDNGLYKVRIEGIRSWYDASRYKRQLQDKNISSFIIENRR